MKKHNWQIRLCTVWLAAILLMASCPFAVSAHSKTIRIGFPIQKGLTEVNPDGTLSGYTYDYLLAIAQYTNWNYEFVQVDGDINQQLVSLLDMLEKGEIDILGGLVFDKSLSEQYDYAGTSYGIAYNVLCVRQDNAEITSMNYFTLPQLRVAMYETAINRREKLQQFSEINNFKVQEVFIHSEEEMIQALADGKADALLCPDVGMPNDDLRIIARFSPEPFYFAATKGQKAIISELNKAIANIQETDPYFMTQLYEKYFGMQNKGLYLSKEEKEYLATNKKPLKVLILDECAPIQYKSAEKEPEGITVEVLNEIAVQTGLQFEIEMVNNWDEYQERALKGDIDILGGIINNSSQLAKQMQYKTSSSYINVPVMMAVSKKIDASQLEGKRLALEYDCNYTDEYKGKILHYNTLKECLDAIQSGNADYCYGNSYSMQYYFNTLEYQNLTLFQQAGEWSQEFCFGISPNAPKLLLPLMNKAIANIPEENLREYFINHQARRPGKITLANYIRENREQVGITAVLITLFGMVIALYSSRRRYIQESQQRLLEAEWYEQISELSNEFLYEYNIAKDQLQLPEKSAEMFGCNKLIPHFSQCKKQVLPKELMHRILSCQSGQQEMLCKIQEGEERWFRVTSKTVTNTDGKTVYAIGKVTDIQKEKEIHADLIERALRDSRTGLYNAVAAKQLINDALKQFSPDEKGALLAIDIDQFKQVNDTLGHHVGDEVIEAVAHVLIDEFRKSDIIGRQGGDEFIVFMRHLADFSHVEGKCRRLEKRIHKIKAGGILQTSISIGAVPICVGDELEERYKQADKALYAAKARGRDCWVLF